MLDILGTTLEKAYFDESTAENPGSTVVQYDKITEANLWMEEWERKYSIFTQRAASGNLGDYTK